MASDTSYYYDFNYSLPLVQMILKLLGKNTEEPNQIAAEGNREWFSQSKMGTDGRTECLTVNFKLPLSVSEISTEIVRMPCNVEIWYQDRSNNWRPVLDMMRTPLKVRVDRADTKSWYKWSNKCYPIVAKKVQFRMTRYVDGVFDAVPFPVGLRNTLIRRNVYDRSHGGFFEDSQDIMGNTVSKYVRDWDASQAIDDNYTTFWKSAPQPDPAAVVSLFLDVRAEDGSAQVIDRVYIDPVYAGQHLNLYYSSDANVGTRTLSPITLAPPEPVDDEHPTVVNVDWRYDKGLKDTSTDPDESLYSWPLNVSSLPGQNGWIGVCWKPDFASTDDPVLAHNIELFAVGDLSEIAAKPVLTYNPTLRTFTLALKRKDAQGNPVSAGTFTTGTISQEWAAGDPIKIVAGWAYDTPNKVWIKVVDARGTTIASLDETTELPNVVSFNGVGRVANFRGTLTALVAKLEHWGKSSESFIANPHIYCEPDPVLPDANGKYPSTTLDNAIYSAPFVSREHGSGGSDRSHFEDKEWHPIWRDYITTKGMLFLPQPISMQYLKLEFTNLTEQPYPIYESGIDVAYKVFPVSVTQQSSIGPRLYTGTGGFLGMGTFISMNGVRSVNWLDPTSVMQAIGAVTTTQIPPVIINTGTPYITTSLPNMGAQAAQESQVIEAASSYVYSREAIQPYILAQNQYNTIIKAEGLQAISPYVDVPWDEIEAANPNSITKVKSTGTVPMRGSDWWIYPGQQLKVPASVMRKLTDTQTVTERKLTLESRSRFSTTCVHRYEWKTVKRDAAIAYFAGVREVQPYISTLAEGEDTPVYKFPDYSDAHWVLENTRNFEKTITDADGNTRVEYGPVTVDDSSQFGVLTSKELVSQSDFTKVTLTFQDSGLVRSNPMWVDIDQNTDTIADTELSPYFGIIPASIPKGNWKDISAKWADADIAWGSAYGLVKINVDPDRMHLGRRVVHFTREAGAGQAGISMAQWVNFSPGAKFRVGASFFRPKATGNNIILRLKRIDGTVILEETLGTPRIIATGNVDIDLPGSIIGGTKLTYGTLVYLNSQDVAAENGLYRWRKETLPLEPVTVGDGSTEFRSVGYAPHGRWATSTTAFAEVPETLSNASFDNELYGWIPHGGTWTAVSDNGYTGLNSAHLATNGTESTLTSEPMECVLGSTVSGSAKITWDGVDTGGTMTMNAVFYNTRNEVVATVPLSITEAIDTTTRTGWGTVGGSTTVPDDLGVTQVAFQVVVPASAGSEGLVWVDDFTVDVPGSPRQQFIAELTIVGDEEEELYVSDLFVETTPIRYFVWLGDTDAEPVEVTDLRYADNQAIVTTSEPVTAIQVQAVITSNRAYAFGCTVTPNYLK